MTYKVRFAPSPTGHIHIGNARTALINWIVSRSSNGQFLLRFDDTDPLRSRQEFADATLQDLRWLGIEPDEIAYQSARAKAHQSAADGLKAKGLLYPCYDTPDELERQRKRQRARGKPPIYDRRALSLSDDERADLEVQGRKPHWRFRLPNYENDPQMIDRAMISWEDGCRGSQSVDIGSMSDPILIREDGSFPYTLPSVVDDIAFGINYIIRGNDHVTNTAAQICLFEALGASPPDFAHHNLLIAADGKGLSKRKGTLSLQELRDDGLEFMAVASLAVLLGTSQAVEPIDEMKVLISRFSLDEVSKAPSRFDIDELLNLNGKMLHSLDFGAVKTRLEGINVPCSESFWLAIRGNISSLPDARDWWKIVSDEFVRSEMEGEDQDFLKAAAQLLPPDPWGDTVWQDWTVAIKTQTGRKGKMLFHPLRLALTGREDGPQLAQLLPIIGRKRILDRLS